MKVKRKDLDPAQVARMKGVYGMTDAQVLAAAQQIVDPSELKPIRVRPTKRGYQQSVSKQSKYS